MGRLNARQNRFFVGWIKQIALPFVVLMLFGTLWLANLIPGRPQPRAAVATVVYVCLLFAIVVSQAYVSMAFPVGYPISISLALVLALLCHYVCLPVIFTLVDVKPNARFPWIEVVTAIVGALLTHTILIRRKLTHAQQPVK